ncbi:RNA 2'-phosphotransferase [Halobellus sp. EA9]|uniref:RNA 2'-phosphotransferase n=1 Tax=Halobellus sp. EA9 TaxID=3421647 RepID=UPI003EBD9AA6
MHGVHECPDHGFVAADSCPDCGVDADPVLSGDRRERLSRFLSYALRHGPGDAGIELTDAGWAPFAEVVAAATEQHDWAGETAVRGVVAVDPKERFEHDGDRIRATYGHSVDVDLESTDRPVPDTLYHGTDPDSVAKIRREGLRPMSRQLVHLSDGEAEALAVGSRHAAEPVLLVVDAAAMLDAGHDITKRGRGVYTTARVPPRFLTLAGGPE